MNRRHFHKWYQPRILHILGRPIPALPWPNSQTYDEIWLGHCCTLYIRFLHCDINPHTLHYRRLHSSLVWKIIHATFLSYKRSTLVIAPTTLLLNFRKWHYTMSLVHTQTLGCRSKKDGVSRIRALPFKIFQSIG